MSGQPAHRRATTSIIGELNIAGARRTVAVTEEMVPYPMEIIAPSEMSPRIVARTMERMQQHARDATQSARSLPCLGGKYWPSVAFKRQQTLIFAHGLGVDVTFLVLDLRPSSVDFPFLIDAGQDAAFNRLYVYSGAKCLADIWVFPRPKPVSAQPVPGRFNAGMSTQANPPVTPATSSGSWHIVTLNPGTASWTAPFTGTIFASWAGGGGGGTGGSGSGTTTAQGGGPGGGGAQLKTYPIDVANGTVYTLTYGAGGGGGAGGASGGANRGVGGSNGGDSLFGSLKTWAGAQGGAAAAIAADGAQGMAPGGMDNKHGVLGQAGGSGLAPNQPVGWGGFAGSLTNPGADNEDGSFFGGGHGTGGFAAGGGGGGGAFGNGGAGGNAGFNTGASAAAGSSAGGGGGGGASTNAPGAGGGNGGSAGPLTIRYFA